jgi:hypothetical protein
MPTNMTLTISGEASTSNETATAAVGPNTTNTTLPVAVDGDLPANVTVDHGQVVGYDGNEPIETAVNGISRIGTHSKYGFGEFRVKPIEKSREKAM